MELLHLNKHIILHLNSIYLPIINKYVKHILIIDRHLIIKMLKYTSRTLFVYEPRPPVDNISGATYIGVPQNVFIMVCASTNFDKPKSDTLAKVISALLANNIFSGYNCLKKIKYICVCVCTYIRILLLHIFTYIK